MVERTARFNLAPALQIISGFGLRVDPFWLGRGAFGGGGNRRQPLDGVGLGDRQNRRSQPWHHNLLDQSQRVDFMDPAAPNTRPGHVAQCLDYRLYVRFFVALPAKA